LLSHRSTPIFEILLLIVLSPTTIASNIHRQLNNPVTPLNKLIHYDFTKSDCSDLGFFENKAIHHDSIADLGTLISNKQKTSCRPSLGIEHTSADAITTEHPNQKFVLKSDTSVAALIHKVQNDAPSEDEQAFTIELWFKPLAFNDSSLVRKPIITIGQDEESASDNHFQRDWCTYFDFRLSQVGNLLQVEYATASWWEPCRQDSLRFAPLTDEITHFVFTLRNGRQSVYINGQPYPYNYDMTDNFLLSSWRPQFSISFFSDFYVHHTQSKQLTTWDGILYSFTLHQGYMTMDDAVGQFSAGPEVSGPLVALDSVVHVNEDGELIAGSHAPNWYHDPFKFSTEDLGRVLLPVDHVDGEVVALIEKHAIVNEALVDRVESIVITQIPEKGTLYQMDGTLIDTIGTEIWTDPIFLPNASTIGAVVYVPEKDQYSSGSVIPYATLSFAVKMASYTTTDLAGEINMFVTKVNDPPDSNSELVRILGEESNERVVIKLNGTDVDGDVVKAVVTQLPQHGSLFSIISFVREKPIYGNLLQLQGNATGIAIPASPVAVVGYQYNGDADAGIVFQDYFQFVVVDQEGRRSATTTIFMEIDFVNTGEPSPQPSPSPTPGPTRIYHTRSPLAGTFPPTLAHGETFAPTTIPRPDTTMTNQSLPKRFMIWFVDKITNSTEPMAWYTMIFFVAATLLLCCVWSLLHCFLQLSPVPSNQTPTSVAHSTPQNKQDPSSVWAAVWDPKEKAYFYVHAVTKEIVWDVPEDV